MNAFRNLLAGMGLLLAGACTVGGGIVLGLLAGLVNAFIFAFPMRALWGWFVAPAFNVSPLTFGQAMGMMIFTTFLLRNAVKTENEGGFFITLANVILTSATFYAFGWFVHFFV